MVGFFRKIEENSGKDSVKWSDLESKSRKQWLGENIPKAKSELERKLQEVEKLKQKIVKMEKEFQNL